MNYEELYNKAQKDLESIRTQKATIKAKIDEAVATLDLDPEQPLEPQVEELKKSLDGKQQSLAKELDTILEQLKQYDEGL
jgi:CHASE3 domain sensor protein